MGHSEMLLAVAGMKDEDLKKQTKKLATGDWAAFTPAEQMGFGIAFKLSRAPWSVTDAEVAALASALGPERAIDLIWRISWANYMTRMADAFQLPLERENVFAPPAPPAAPKPEKK